VFFEIGRKTSWKTLEKFFFELGERKNCSKKFIEGKIGKEARKT